MANLRPIAEAFPLRGRRATLKGLQKKPEFNGIPGTIGEFLSGKDRFEFFPDHVEKYAGGMARMQVKKNNLDILPEGTQEVINISGVFDLFSGGRSDSGGKNIWVAFESAGDRQHGRGEILDAVRDAVGVSRKVIDKTDAIAVACRGVKDLGKDDTAENLANLYLLFRDILIPADTKALAFLFLTPETRTAIQTLGVSSFISQELGERDEIPHGLLMMPDPSFLMVFFNKEGDPSPAILDGKMEDTLAMARRKVPLGGRFFRNLDGILMYYAFFPIRPRVS